MQVQRTQNRPSYRPAFEKLDVNWRSLKTAGRNVKQGVEIALTPAAPGLKSEISRISQFYDVTIHGTPDFGGMVKYVVRQGFEGKALNNGFGSEGLSAQPIASTLQTAIGNLYNLF